MQDLQRLNEYGNPLDEPLIPDVGPVDDEADRTKYGYTNTDVAEMVQAFSINDQVDSLRLGDRPDVVDAKALSYFLDGMTLGLGRVGEGVIALREDDRETHGDKIAVLRACAQTLLTNIDLFAFGRIAVDQRRPTHPPSSQVDYASQR